MATRAEGFKQDYDNLFNAVENRSEKPFKILLFVYAGFFVALIGAAIITKKMSADRKSDGKDTTQIDRITTFALTGIISMVAVAVTVFLTVKK
jgi:H+/Cl- antiporter ClcA